MLDKLLFRIEGISHAILRNAVYAVISSALTIGIAIGLATAVVGVWMGSSIEESLIWLALFAACFVMRAIIEASSDAYARRYALNRCSDLRARYMRSIYVLGGNRDEHGAASVSLEGVDGIENIGNYLISMVPKIVDVVVVPFILCIAIYTQDVISGIIVSVCYPFIMLFMKLIGHSASDEASKRHDGFKRMSGHFADSMRGIFTLRAFGASTGYAKKVFAASERYRKLTMKTLRIAMLSGAVLDIFATCGLAAVAIMLGFRMVDGDVAFLPALVTLVLTPEFFKPIRRFASDYHASLDGRSSLHSVFEAIDAAKRALVSSFGRESFEEVGLIERTIEAWGAPVDDQSAHAAGSDADARFSALSGALELRNIEFAYNDEKPILRNVSLELEYGKWVLLVGESGQGKSTLADIMAGFTSPTNGEIRIGDVMMLTLAREEWRRRVAYIPQSPYIFNATLRENLAFYDPDCDDEAIMEVVYRLGLQDFINALPQGLDTPIGDGVRSFSGGQLQRIALARALLDEARDIWILDEPTAHLDIETELDLKEQMVSLMAGKTVLIISHRMHWAQVVDTIFTLEDGCIVDAVAGGANRDCASDHNSCAEGVVADEALGAACDAASTLREGLDDAELSRTKKDIDASDPRILHQDDLLSSSANELSRRDVVIRVRGFLSKHRKPLFVSLALSLFANIFACGLMFTSGFMISLAASIPATALALHIPSLFVRIFGIGKPCISYVERLGVHDWILRITSDLRSGLFRFMDMRAARSKGFKIATGDALAFFSQTMEHLQDLLIRGVLPLIVMALTLVVIVALSAVFSVGLASAFAVVLIVVAIAMPYLAARKRKGDIELAAKIRHSLLRASSDNVYGLKDWMLSGRESEFIHLDDQDRADLDDIEQDQAAGARGRLIIYNVSICALIVCVFLWAASSFTDPGFSIVTGAVSALGNMPIQDATSYPANWIAAFVLCVIPMAEIFFRASDDALVVAGRISSVRAICAIEKELESDADRSCPSCVSDVTSVSDDKGEALIQPSCAIELMHAAFSYGGAAQGDSALCFDMSIGRGQRIAIIGKSGAGKSTLAKIIAGELELDSGTLRILGKDISCGMAEFHQLVGVVEQDPYVFDQSLRENLLLAKPLATDEELLDVLAKVGLSRMLDRREAKLGTSLGELGANISGGERTRLAIARVLLMDSPIVVLDEPFCGLDPKTEDAITDVIFTALAGKTVILITHHLRNIERFDRVVMVANGKIAADDDPDTLARKNAHFAELLAFEKGI